jgi:predicted DNA-binding transcriptional regulator AlpA
MFRRIGWASPAQTEGGTMTQTKRVLRAPEAAAYTGLSESTLAKRRLYGQQPPFLNLGGRAIGYAIDDLDAWLKSCRRQSTSQQSTS